MQHKLYIKTLIASNWRGLICSFALYLAGQLLDNFRKKVVDFQIDEITSAAHTFSKMRLLTFRYCSKKEYAEYLFQKVLIVMGQLLALRLSRLLLDFLVQRKRFQFLQQFQLQVLTLMLYSYINLPELTEPPHKPEAFHEAAGDFAQLFYAFFVDVVTPIISVFVDLFASNFKFRMVSIVVPILPLFFTFKIVAALSNKSRTGFKKVRRATTERQAFITNLQSRRLLIKSYNSFGYELKFVRENVKHNSDQTESNQRYSRAQRVIERVLEVYQRLTVTYFKLKYILFEGYTTQRVTDYHVTISNIYRLQKSFIDFNSKMEGYINAFELVKTVFNYQVETQPLTSIKEVKSLFTLQESLQYNKNCTRLVVRNVGFQLGEKRIFDNLNLELSPGFYLLQGRSGSGKSTLFKLLGGIYQPNRGEILLDGAQETDVLALRSVVTIVHQQDAPIQNLSLEKHITYGLPFDEARYARVCGICGVAFSGSRVQNLSGGQQQRVSLARGLYRAQSHSVLLLDESTNGLDAALEEQVLCAIKHYCASHGIICMLISHRNSCRAVADTILNIETMQQTANSLI